MKKVLITLSVFFIFTVLSSSVKAQYLNGTPGELAHFTSLNAIEMAQLEIYVECEQMPHLCFSIQGLLTNPPAGLGSLLIYDLVPGICLAPNGFLGGGASITYNFEVIAGNYQFIVNNPNTGISKVLMRTIVGNQKNYLYIRLDAAGNILF